MQTGQRMQLKHKNGNFNRREQRERRISEECVPLRQPRRGGIFVDQKMKNISSSGGATSAGNLVVDNVDPDAAPTGSREFWRRTFLQRCRASGASNIPDKKNAKGVPFAFVRVNSVFNGGTASARSAAFHARTAGSLAHPLRDPPAARDHWPACTLRLPRR
jgi:hypothetical protein